MTDRHFPDDHEIDQWLNSCSPDDDTDANPVLDQLQAATVDSINRFRINGPRLVAAGAAERYIEIPDPDRNRIRGAIRQLLVAMSAGIMPLCQHTNLIRPLILVCDPPVVCCTQCFPSRMDVIATLGYCWDNECDRCGVYVEMLTPCSIGGVGPLTITGHVCGSCANEDQHQAVGLVGRTGNRQARRRGGAR